MTANSELNTKSKPPYLLGLIGLIPLVGFFVGLGLLLYSIFRYKDKKLTIIGILCMLFTIVVYSSLFYFGFKSDSGKKGWAQMAQLQLNSLIENVEYFKIENGHYPDSLQQLKSKKKFLIISDPLRSIDRHTSTNYNYSNLGNRYLLYSSGIDGIANTEDDIYPEIDTSNSHIGWTKSE